MSGGIDIIDFEASTFRIWAVRGNGGFRKPHGIAVAADGTRYVADSIQGEILIYDAEGRYRAAFGSPETMKPTDVEVWKEKLFVVNLKQKRIEVYDRHSKALLMTIPGEGAPEDAAERLFSPTNVDVDEEGRIYVSDTGGFFVKVFNPDGTLARNFGSIGAHYGGMIRPKGIAADREGRVYVADAGTAVVQIFNEDDKLLLFFGKVGDPERNLVLPAGLHIDYENTEYFAPYVAPGYALEYLLYIADQYGPTRLKVYGFIQPEQGAESSAVTDDGSHKK
jgi:DNA-binding beta-propeller fold protein YncE